MSEAGVKAPSVVGCLLRLAAVDLCLRVFGLRRTSHWLRRWLRREERAVPASAMTETVRAVATSAVFYPRRAMCLEQSLVIYWVLRRHGAPVQLRVGVMPFPFTAHAWVEHNGRPINEHEDFVMRLTPFPSFGA